MGGERPPTGRRWLYEGGGLALGFALLIAGVTELQDKPSLGLGFTVLGFVILVGVWFDAVVPLWGPVRRFPWRRVRLRSPLYIAPISASAFEANSDEPPAQIARESDTQSELAASTVGASSRPV